MELRSLEKASTSGYNSVNTEERRRRSSRDQRVQIAPRHQSKTLDSDPHSHSYNHSIQRNKFLTVRTDPDPDDPARVPERPTNSSPPLVPATSAPAEPPVKYSECQKNHAASSGRYVVDGCGEFMPGGGEGSADYFRCAACECHRSFHRKETDGEPVAAFPHRQGQIGNFALQGQNDRLTLPYYARNSSAVPLPQPPPVNRRGIQSAAAAPAIMMSFGGAGLAAESSTEDLNMFHHHHNYDDEHNNGFADHQQKPKKRFRTKFNQEQKDKMMEFAERLGWKMQKQDEEEVQRFCAETNVKRQVFKVWMHNNKQAMKKKQV